MLQQETERQIETETVSDPSIHLCQENGGQAWTLTRGAPAQSGVGRRNQGWPQGRNSEARFMAGTMPKRVGEERRAFEAGEQDVQNPRD